MTSKLQPNLSRIRDGNVAVSAQTPERSKRGYCGIGIWEPKDIDNFGGLVRSAFCFGADFVFTIGNRYRKQPTDTANATLHMPLFHYKDMADFLAHVPDKCDVVGVEITPKAKSLESYGHPERAIYILGGEDRTLPPEVTDNCTSVRRMGTKHCLNVASAATVVLYDRHLKSGVVAAPEALSNNNGSGDSKLPMPTDEGKEK